MDLHIIQRRILDRVVLGHHRFSEIKPDDIEGNLFQYHLGKLIAANIIKKTDNGYELTPRGDQIASQWSSELQSVRIQPVIVTMIILADRAGKIAVLQRSAEPFLGMLTPPFGKVHYTETLLDAARREIKEKIGINYSGDLKSAGMLEINLENAHMIAHVFRGILSDEYVGQKMTISELLKDPNLMTGLDVLSQLES